MHGSPGGADTPKSLASICIDQVGRAPGKNPSGIAD